MTNETVNRLSPVAVFIRIAGAAALALALLLGIHGPAAAQQAGIPRTEVVKQLKARHAEAPVALGLANNGGVIEVFTTQDRSTWTLVLTMPNGMSAVIAAGESWTSVAKLPGRKS